MTKGKTILELRIRIWAPMDPRDKYLARIGNLPIQFKGSSPMMAHKAADDWRKEEVARLEADAAKRAERRAAKASKPKAAVSPPLETTTSTVTERQEA